VSSDTRESHDEATYTPLLDGSEQIGELVMYVSELDGATVVEVQTGAGIGRLRVYVNDGAIFDQSPEERGPHGECGYAFRTASGAHRCGARGAHSIHFCRHCGASQN
jgi:hypothetical protein